jgi:hypothetical protein
MRISGRIPNNIDTVSRDRLLCFAFTPIETPHLHGHPSNDAASPRHRTTHGILAAPGLIHGCRASFTCKSQQPEVVDHTNGGMPSAVKDVLQRQLCFNPLLLLLLLLLLLSLLSLLCVL